MQILRDQLGGCSRKPLVEGCIVGPRLHWHRLRGWHPGSKDLIIGVSEQDIVDGEEIKPILTICPWPTYKPVEFVHMGGFVTSQGIRPKPVLRAS
jgi:hypothetical protein